MFEFDFEKRLLTVCNSIDENIMIIAKENRGVLAQNILKLLRDLVDVFAVKLAIDSGFTSEIEYEYIIRGHKIFLSDRKYGDLERLHNNLLISNSHYTEGKFESEALMCSYYENIIGVKDFAKDKYNLSILKEVDKYPLDMDKENENFYREIKNKLMSLRINYETIYMNFGREKYYVQSQKMVIIDGTRFYESTLSAARDDATRFDRITVFSKNRIKTRYAIQISKYTAPINALNSTISIIFVLDYQISIRYSELKHISEIVGLPYRPSKSNSLEYVNLMNVLNEEHIDLLDIVTSDKQSFSGYIARVGRNSKYLRCVGVLRECRDIIVNKKNGYRLLKYFLFTMKNKVLYDQIPHEDDYKVCVCNKMTVKSGSLVFNDLPFSSSLVGHSVSFGDVVFVLPDEITDEEVLAKQIHYNTLIDGKMYTQVSELTMGENIDELISKYNSKVYYKHTNRFLARYGNKVFIQGYEDDIYNIILLLANLTNVNNESLRDYINKRLKQPEIAKFLESPEKNNIYQNMFSNSNFLLLYGSAGTGKTFTIEAISSIFSACKILYLANTHSAVENLKRRVGKAKGRLFKTIESFTKSEYYLKQFYDFIIIDECSTISNESILKVLRSAIFSRLVLSGDIYQIESIDFGNWFGIVKEVFEHFELMNPFRTQNNNLLELWKNVREFDDSLIAKLSRTSFSKRFNELLLENKENSIFLCLNYDGLFGINNINRYLQEKNKGESVEWNVWKFKVGDPILFNDNYHYKNVLYNNLKGKISKITKNDEKVEFEILVDDLIDGAELSRCGGKMIEVINGKSLISLTVYFDSDESEDENWKTMVPFQVAYAISIHKAQGLEYDNVNVLISKDNEERITFNIFYTAITRAKNKLVIYWSPETMSNVLKAFHKKNYKEDKNVLLSKRPLPDII